MKYRLFALLLGLFGLSFYWFDYSNFTLQTNPSNLTSNPFRFKASDMTWLENIPYSSQPATAGAFFNTGDGGFYLGSYDNFESNFTWHFANSTTSNTWLEVTPKYDKNDPPPKRVALPVTPGSGSTTVNSSALLNGKTIVLQASRKPSPGDMVNYIIAFKRPSGTNATNFIARLNLPIAVFDMNSVEQEAYIVRGNSANFAFDPADVSTGKLKWNITNWPPGDSGTIIVSARTLADAAIDQNSNVTALVAVNDSAFVESNMDNMAQVTVRSHDPNYKTVKPRVMTSGTTSLMYTIHFQNEGKAPATHVRIHDIFDREIKVQNLRVLGGMPVRPDTIERKSGCQSVVFDFNLRNNPLRGLGEPGCGRDFPIDQTMGSVQFIIEIDRSTLKPCSAILNEADIYFEDDMSLNAPVHTTQAVCQIPCKTGDTCVIESKTDLPAQNIAPGSSVQVAISIPPSFSDVKWYPCEGVDVTDPRNPIFSPNRPILYTCVAADPTNCKQRFIRQFVDPRPALGPGQGTDQSGGNSSWPMGWIWAAILGFFGVVAAFILGRKKPPISKGQQQGH